MVITFAQLVIGIAVGILIGLAAASVFAWLWLGRVLDK